MIDTLPTPQTKSSNTKIVGPKAPVQKGDESFEWSSSDDEELLKAEQEVLQGTPYETPTKIPRTQVISSPGKRTFHQMAAQSVTSSEIWPLSDDVFTTPSTSHKSHGTGILSPAITPATRAALADAGQLDFETSTLAAEALKILKDSNSQLSAQTKNELVELLNMHDLRTQGIIKGRDITRVAIHTKDKKIVELQNRIQTLEAEKETSRRVIGHLKTDMAHQSPKKGNGRRNVPPGRRSEV